MAYYPVISGPVAPYSNLPIKPQWFQPSQFDITAITFGVTTVVTMANGTNNVTPNYVIGQLVRLVIPAKYGSTQLNGQSGFVISAPSASQVEIAIYSLGTDPFIASPTFLPYQSQTPAQILAMGNIAGGQINSSGRINLGTTIPGAFQNVSP
jgi:hypothetical protein